MTHVPTVAAVACTTTGLATIGSGAAGLAAGFAAGVYAEVKLRDFEEKYKLETYKVRWCATFGLISSSIIVTVGAASADIGLAIIAVAGISLTIKRYLDHQAVLAAQQREDAARVLMGSFDDLDDKIVIRFMNSQNISIEDLAPHINNVSDEDAAAQFIRIRSLLRARDQ